MKALLNIAGAVIDLSERYDVTAPTITITFETKDDLNAVIVGLLKHLDHTRDTEIHHALRIANADRKAVEIAGVPIVLTRRRRSKAPQDEEDDAEDG